MRVTGGEARGRRLTSFEDRGSLRPMTDQIREALFSTLGHRVPGARVLDLYAGSGSVGIEALSRGASHVTFVERERAALDVIRANLEITGFGQRASVVASDVEQFVASPTSPVPPFDLVVVDPPFRDGIPGGMLESLAGNGFLTTGALIVLRVATRLAATEVPHPLRLGRTRRYGDSTLIYMSVEEGLK